MRRLLILLACILMAGCVTTGTPTPTRTPPTVTATQTLEPVDIGLPTFVSRPTAQNVYLYLTAVGYETRRDVTLEIGGTSVPYVTPNAANAPTPTITPVPPPRGAWHLCVFSPSGVMVGCAELR